MKKKIIIIVSVVLILLILFLPIPRGTYRDGGTKDYCALTYRIVVWNRLTNDPSRDASVKEIITYHKTSVFWFPKNFKSIDELWEMEYEGNKVINDFSYTEKQPIHSDDLREKYPEYYGLSTFKGLEVYVWQMAPDSYSCGVMEGTNREKTLEELMALKGASIDEMKTILSGYDIPKENISIIPWQNPVSSYIGEYWLSLENEDPHSEAERRQQYVDRLREMLLDDKPIFTKVSYANWTDDSRIFSCLNAEKMAISSVRHLPVYKLDTKDDLDQFREKYRDVFPFEQGYDEVPSFNEATAGYDDNFFAEHTVILAYVTANSGSLRFGIRDIYQDDSLFCLNVMQMNDPEVGTTDMAGWFMFAEIPDADLEGIADFDAKIVEN